MTLRIILTTCGNKCLLDLLDGFKTLPRDRPELEFVLVMNGEGLEPRVTFETARDALVQHFRCRYAYLPNRIGYVKAVDLGWKLAEPAPDDLVAVLSDDVVIEGDWITPMIEVLQGKYPNSQVGPSVKWVGPDALGYPSQHPHDHRSPYLEGWCWMARAETITRAGGIVDLGFEGSYCEDCDLSLRIAGSGGSSIIHVPGAPIRHIGHGSSSPEMMAHFAKNRQYLAEKWDLRNGGLRGSLS